MNTATMTDVQLVEGFGLEMAIWFRMMHHHQYAVIEGRHSFDALLAETGGYTWDQIVLGGCSSEGRW